MSVKLDLDGIRWSADNTILESKNSIFPQGTVWIFFQSSTPVGWSRYSALNDSMLRVVDADFKGQSQGGSQPFSGTFSNSAKTFTISGAGNLESGSTTVSKAQIPTHTHGFGGQTITDQPARNPDGEYTSGNMQRAGTPTYPFGSGGIQGGGLSGDTGGGGGHQHEIFIGESFSVSIPLSVQYIDVFFASFNG
jgi:hypothetical protein